MAVSAMLLRQLFSGCDKRVVQCGIFPRLTTANGYAEGCEGQKRNAASENK